MAADRTVDRRSALRVMAAGVVGSVASPLLFASLAARARHEAHGRAARAAMAAQDWTPRVLTGRRNETVIALTELIIPETDTPGAKAVHVNRFIDHVLESAVPAEREAFLKGVAWIDARSRALFDREFTDALPDQQAQLLTRLAAEGNPEKEEEIGREFFEAIKSMTIDGYYTTEIGLRQELGDPGTLFLLQFPGCDHPEHR